MPQYPENLCPLITQALTSLLGAMAFNYLREDGHASHIGDGTTLITFTRISGSAEMLLGEVTAGSGAAGIDVQARVPMNLADGWWLLVEIIADGSMFAVRYDSVEAASDEMMQPAMFTNRIRNIAVDPLFIIENCQRGGIVRINPIAHESNTGNDPGQNIFAGSIESVSSIKSIDSKDAVDLLSLQEIWSANMDPDRKYAYHLHKNHFYILGY